MAAKVRKYEKKHTKKEAFYSHLAKLRARNAEYETKGLTIVYWFPKK